MNNPNGTTTIGNENLNPAEAIAESKGKGKAVDTNPHDMMMDDDDDDSSDEETGAEEEVPPIY